MKATRALLEERVGQPWNVDEVAARARVTRMTVYRHFGSRTELLLATVRHVDDQEDARGRFGVLAEVGSAADALEQWVDTWAGYLPKIHRLAQALLAARESDPAAAAAWSDRVAFLRQGCRHMVQRLDEEGLLASELEVEHATDLMLALVSPQLWDALVEELEWPVARYRAQLKRALAKLLLRVT